MSATNFFNLFFIDAFPKGARRSKLKKMLRMF